MRTDPIVLSVSDSPVLQETLAILLEHDCRFRRLTPSEVDAAALSMPDLALVSGTNARSTIDQLVARRPTLPIVVIGADAVAPVSRLAARTVRNVPLDPGAIRAAVREHLPPSRDTALRETVASIVHTLRTDLDYPFTALRTFTSARVTQGGERALPMVSAIVHEQCAVLDGYRQQLGRFQARARDVTASPDFSDVFCNAMHDAARTTDRGFFCECSSALDRSGAPGPAPLAALVAGLVMAHVRRRAAAPLLRIRPEGGAIAIRYATRLSVRHAPESVALLLATLALQPFSWSVRVDSHSGEDTIYLISAEARS